MINLLPKDEKFYDELEELGRLVESSAGELTRLVAAFPEAAEGLRHLTEQDRRADELTQNALERLDRAFITPLDREDILHLLTDLYTVVETCTASARRLSFYRLAALEPALREQAELLAQMAASVSAVMSRLRKNHELQTLNGEIKKLHELVRRSDERGNAFLEGLFQGDPAPLEVMKKKELHDLLVRAIGNCRDVSRTLQRVVLKNS